MVHVFVAPFNSPYVRKCAIAKVYMITKTHLYVVKSMKNTILLQFLLMKILSSVSAHENTVVVSKCFNTESTEICVFGEHFFHLVVSFSKHFYFSSLIRVNSPHLEAKTNKQL